MTADLFSEHPPPSAGEHQRAARAAASARSDVCSQKHGGHENSEAANERIEPHKEAMREQILKVLRARGAFGATCDELCALIRGFKMHSVSGRLKELKDVGLIREDGRKRASDGGSPGAVVVIVDVPQKG